MAQQSRFNLWVRAWLLLPLSVIGLCVMCQVVAQRWKMLHGAQAVAVVHRQLGKEGSGSGGVYHIVAKYRQPQGPALFARIATDRSTHDKLIPGTEVQVGYEKNRPQQALLASEWSFDGKSIVMSLATLVLLFSGINASQTWRHQRRDGYLPD